MHNPFLRSLKPSLTVPPLVHWRCQCTNESNHAAESCQLTSHMTVKRLSEAKWAQSCNAYHCHTGLPTGQGGIQHSH